MLALYVIAGIILLVILVLSVPVDLTFDLATQGEGRRKLRVGWLFGLVGRDVLPRRKKRPPKAKKEKKARKRKRPDMGLFLSVLRTRGLVGGVVRLGRRMLRSLRFRELDAGVRIGLSDPADTGLMYAALWPALLLRDFPGGVRLRVEPAFEGATFEADVRGQVRVFPAQVAANALRSVLSPAGLRTIRLMVVSWWRKRK